MTTPSKTAKRKTAPLECIECEQAIGPECPIDADHAGWMCDECYQEAQERYHYVCSVCACGEEHKNYRRSYVCPWCGEGVMQLEDN